jgi:hypothetical protein
MDSEFPFWYLQTLLAIVLYWLIKLFLHITICKSLYQPKYTELFCRLESPFYYSIFIFDLSDFLCLFLFLYVAYKYRMIERAF